MRVAVVGGKLQGVEACYLAKRAGWEVILFDKDPSAPARGLCDLFVCHDVVRQSEKNRRIIHDVDFIIPAMEDTEGLRCLVEAAVAVEVPMAFDPDAYAITSSKRRSDDLFHRLGLSVPRPWPNCGPPVIVKPIGSSGSKGVRKIADQKALNLFVQENQSDLDQWIIQEYVTGPSYSLEVISLDGQCVTLQTTALEMDATFDCKRVLAPVDLPASLDRALREVTSTLAQTLHLDGIMDVEVIHHADQLRILEIDARLPSQTPTAVEYSRGINMLELLREVFADSRLPEVSPILTPRGVVYEHVRVWGNHLEVSGEHIMTQGGPLHMEDDFFGADAALTNFSGPDRPWVATLIVSDTNRERAWDKRCGVVRAIMDGCALSDYQDPAPDDWAASREGRR